MEEQLRREEFLRSAEEWESILGRSIKANSIINNNPSTKGSVETDETADEDDDEEEEDKVSHTGTRETLVCSVSAAAAAAREERREAAVTTGSADSMRTVFSKSENAPFSAVEEEIPVTAPLSKPTTEASSSTERSSASSSSLNRSIRLANVIQDTKEDS